MSVYRRFLFLLIFWALWPSVNAQKMIPYRQGKVWGFANKNGDVVIPCNFERTTFFEGDLARVKKNGKWGLMDHQGQMFIPCAYDIVYGAMKNERIVVCVGGDKDGHHGRWGMVPRYQGKDIELKFDLMRECGVPGLLSIYKEGRWGLLNQFSKITIPIQFEVQDIIDHQFDQSSTTLLKQSNISQLFPRQPKQYLKLRFKQGLARVSKQGKWGYINPHGAEVITVKYEFIGEFSEGLVCAIKEVGNQLKIGFLDREHQIKIPFEYEFVEEAYKYLSFSEGLVPLKKDGKWGYVNASNEVVIPFQFLKASLFSDEMALVSNSMSSLMPSWKVIDLDGKIIFSLDQKYQPQKAYFEEGFLIVEHQGKKAFMNKKGDLISKFYTDVYPFRDGLAQVVGSKEGKLKTGFINQEGKEVIPLVYDCSEKPHPIKRWGRYLFPTKDGQKGIVDTKNNVVISFRYDDILLPGKEAFNMSHLGVKKEGYWGYINQKEKWVIPAKYDKVYNFKWKYALVNYKGNIGYINRKGEEFFED